MSEWVVCDFIPLSHTSVCVCSLQKAGIEAEELCNMHMYKFVFDLWLMTKALEIDRPWQKHKMCNILKTYIHTHFFVFDCLQLSRNFVVCLNFQVSFLSKNTQFSTQFGRCFTQIEKCFNVKCLCDHQLPIPTLFPIFHMRFSAAADADSKFLICTISPEYCSWD
jgi:hypothetical protein